MLRVRNPILRRPTASCVPSAVLIQKTTRGILCRSISMSGSKAPRESAYPHPRPSASVLLISPLNTIILLHRVQSSSSFPSAHVFPGGNLSPVQDGAIPAPKSPLRHIDSPIYRLAAIRECFEESGILLARDVVTNAVIEVPEAEREAGRRDVHAGKVKFIDWLAKRGAIPDTDGLLPFTRWITPLYIKRRFTTQMYIYFLPLTNAAMGLAAQTAGNHMQAMIPTATSDGGKEHTTAAFAPAWAWLERARRNEIILFPPQAYLLHLLAGMMATKGSQVEGQALEDLARERTEINGFLEGGEPSWGEKCICPTPMQIKMKDGRTVLNLDQAGSEVEGRGGDKERVILVRFSDEGPRDVEVRWRDEAMAVLGKGESQL